MITRFKTLDNWNEDKEMPITKTMKTKIIEALPCFIKYIKQKYVLKNIGFSMKTEEFFDMYYSETRDKTSKQKLGKYLTQLKIFPIKVNRKGVQYYKYEITSIQLHKEFVNKKWIDENTDKIDGSTSFSKSVFNDDDKIDQTILLQKQITELKLMIITSSHPISSGDEKAV